MHVPFFPLAAIGNLDAEAVSYQFIGMLVVFCCLGLLSIILTISGSVAVRMEAKRNARQAAAKAALTSSAAASSPTTSEPSPQQIAALAADGVSRISQLHFIDRGYERFEDLLSSLGADIVRE